MQTFEKGDIAKYVSSSGNMYWGTVRHCFGPNTPSGVLGAPNACILIVNDRIIVNDNLDYIYPIGSEMLIHRSRLTKDMRGIESLIKAKGQRQALANVYEAKTWQSAGLNHGPLGEILSFLGNKVPKGAQGGKRTRRTRRTGAGKRVY